MNGNYLLNLIVLGLAILLIIIAQQRIQPDKFVGKVPLTLIGNGGYDPYFIKGVYPTGQPMTFSKQLYPAKIPWYTQYNRPCKYGCGTTGVCKNGKCTGRDQNKTVFDIKI